MKIKITELLIFFCLFVYPTDMRKKDIENDWNKVLNVPHVNCRNDFFFKQKKAMIKFVYRVCS